MNRHLSFRTTTPQFLCTPTSFPLTASPDLARNALIFLGDIDVQEPQKAQGVVDDDDAEPITTSKGKGPSVMQPAASVLYGLSW